MKMISWNVNGLRAAVGKGFVEYFKEADADIFSLQELQMELEYLVPEIYPVGPNGML